VGIVYLEGAKEIVKPTVAPKFFLPLTTMELDQPFLGVLRLHVGAANADLRATMYGIPKMVQPSLATNFSVLRSVHSNHLSLSAESSVPQEVVVEEDFDGDQLGLLKKQKAERPVPPLSGEVKVPPSKSRLSTTSTAARVALLGHKLVAGELSSLSSPDSDI
jgi:hypothetical protein